ncbi:Clavaminate synthase-like protein [Gautieria morchelliformis]|nr:Clavaminate synthase-like protein [Gautieria morchelliformis]
MTFDVVPLPLPVSVDTAQFREFGREVIGADLTRLSQREFQDIENLLYKHGVLLFRNVRLTPEEQYTLTKAFDPCAQSYGHGNNKLATTKSILNPLLTTIPRVPQVQLVGNGTVHDHEGIVEATLRHAHHKTFHKTHVSETEEKEGYTRFYRWHMDAALYEFEPPIATTLYALKVPKGPHQTVKYDDGTGDKLSLPLAATVFTSGLNTFNLLSPALKSVAVRSHVRYAPHPFIWMGPARALPTGLGIESEGCELSLDELPKWEDSKVKTYPMVWKNPVTGALYFQVHGCAAMEIIIDPAPLEKKIEGSLYTQGAHLTNLTEVRRLLYEMQRPGISPSLVYPHDWHENDLIIFHNRGVLHSVTGALNPDQVRIYHQCNLAASDGPVGPSAKDVKLYA